ncbi:hypothetical protein [Pedobacter rhizosphaerae]|uniref:Uncharacterized protein n=1 Tax=Pedobacter rhizosphaerae TaxID=390241 RepID=A0A1H9VG05_9SPHI|nr:hypothetical protein [Pedobacter rhizosphaerae]SES20167.1 hypothetical protein SAMN04488023_14213 [Pedobacter rhizosphaerae]
MKRILLLIALSVSTAMAWAQVTNLAPGEYKNVVVPNYNYNGDYTRNLILLHEMYNDQLLGVNYTIGTLTALRGYEAAWNRYNVATINTAASYASTSGSISSVYNSEGAWKLKTCFFNSKKYLAVEVPYHPSVHNHGYKFTGWTTSTGENLLAVSYEVNGQPTNQNVLTNIQDFVPTNNETLAVNEFHILGNVGIGTTTPKEKLSVNGKVRAHEVKVEIGNWPDYVFKPEYKLQSLAAIEKEIKAKGHLPGMPSADEIESNGLALGEVVKLQQEKIEELTLHLIEKEKEIERLKQMEQRINKLESALTGEYPSTIEKAPTKKQKK